jgi:multiple sugar transport system substrate-binding protein
MKKARRYMILALLVMGALIVNVCIPTTPASATTPEQTAEEEVVLNIMDNWGDQADAKGPPLQSIFQDFMKAYPNIKIKEEVFVDKDIPPKVTTAHLAGEEPDLVFVNLWPVTQDWGADGVTIYVENLAKEWGLEDQFKPIALKDWTDSQGHLLAFPVEGYIWPVWYNTKILKEAGVEQIPKTTDELIKAAQKVRAAGYDPFVTGGLDWTGYSVFELVAGTMLTDEQLKQLAMNGGWADNPNAVKAVQLMLSLRDGKVFADDTTGLEMSTMNERFFSGKAAMMHAGSWSFSECPAELKSDVVLAGFPLPADAVRQHPVIFEGFDAKGIWVTRNGAQKMDAVEKFIKFFYQPEMIERLVEQGAMPSPLKTTPVDESKIDPLFAQALALSDVDAPLFWELYLPVQKKDAALRALNEGFLPGTDADSLVTSLDEPYK